MSIFNPLARANVPTHRSSFDMSTKRLFTAKVGELLPIWWTMSLPGDKFKLSVDSFTRTVPVNTAAYTRIKEYFDFFCVPLRYFQSNLNNALMQMTDYATSAKNNKNNVDALKYLPFASTSALNDQLLSMHAQDKTGKPSTGFNAAGLYRSVSALKLLDILGYQAILTGSNVSDSYTSEQEALLTDYFGGFKEPGTMFLSFGSGRSFSQNLCPLFAYQKIYYDFYSNSQWETHKAYAYNIDYVTGLSPLIQLTAEMMELHYANYPLDYIQGVLPKGQFGDVATLPGIQSSDPSNSVVTVYNTFDGENYYSKLNVADSQSSVQSEKINKSGKLQPLIVNADLSALSIRATELLQRWKEVLQFNSKDFKDQVKAQFGVSAPEYMGNHCHYIGGIDNVISINEVVNTNLTDNAHQAVVAGKGVSSQSGKTLSFDAPSEHCVIMCIYHAVPLCDYDINGIAPQLLDVQISDLPQPAFDNLGLEPFKSAAVTTDTWADLFNGYTVRYSAYKSDIDRVVGGFRRLAPYHAWVAPLTSQDLIANYGATDVSNAGVKTNYTVFKVKPQQLNSIFVPQVDRKGGVDKDQLLVNSYVKCYKVTNLSRSGIPW